MLTIFLLAFRESFEAWVVAGVIITYLKTTKRLNLLPAAYSGVLAGIISSLIAGIIIFSRAHELSEYNQNIIEGAMTFLATALIAYFVVWISRNKGLSNHIKNKVEKQASNAGIFLLSFISIFREGIELIIFILTKVESSPQIILLVSLAGVVVSLIVVIGIFYAAAHYMFKNIFRLLGLILIYFGAEIFSEGVIRFFPIVGEQWELVLFLIFALPVGFVFFKDDLKKLGLK